MAAQRKPQAGWDTGLGRARKIRSQHLFIKYLISRYLIFIPADLWLAIIVLFAEVQP